MTHEEHWDFERNGYEHTTYICVFHRHFRIYGAQAGKICGRKI